VNPVVAGLFGAVLYFGTAAEVRRFESLAAKEIQSKLEGPDAKVTVRSKLNGFAGLGGDLSTVTIRASDFTTDGLPLFTEPELSKRGRVRDLRLILERFNLGGLDVARLEARIPDCRYDFGLAVKKHKIRLSKSGEGSGFVEVGQEALERFVLRKFHEIKTVKIRLADDRVFVEGYGEFIVFNTGFSVEARLVTSDGIRLSLADAKIVLDGKEADEAQRKVLLDTLNPVVDLDKDLNLYGAVTVERILLQNGVLRAEGKTRIPIRPVEGERGACRERIKDEG
jgi:hypothetical protein